MSDLYSVLLAWTIAVSGYAPPSRLPEVVIVPRSYLERKACPATPCKALAWYPDTGGTKVYLDNRLNPQASIIDASFLVREFVRYLQRTDGKMDNASDCEVRLSLEREAYGVQRKFLAAHGLRIPVGASILSARCV